jgi:uroporphyrinogen-III synthase
MTGWRLLLTRPEPECSEQRVALEEHGIQGACLPLLAIEALAETAQQSAIICALARYSLVIAISKPAARLGLARIDRYWPQPLSDQPWFCLGSATGQILADYGLVSYWPDAAQDSEALLADPRLQARLSAALFPRVLIIRGEGGRTLLADHLRLQGVAVDELPVYRRFLPSYPTATLRQRIQVERLNGLVVSSGQGLVHLHQLAKDDWHQLVRLPLFVPSSRVAELAREQGATQVVNCNGASTTALLAALQRQAAPDG